MTPRPPDQEERFVESWLEATAASMPFDVLDRALATVRDTPQRQAGWRSWLGWGRRLLVPAAALAAAIAVAVGIVPELLRQPLSPGAGSPPPTGFVGEWSTIDCAHTELGSVACARWGDQSALALTIQGDEASTALYRDSSAACAGTSPFVATGSGRLEPPFLWLTFDRTGCGSFGDDGDGRVQLYHDPESDTLWEDEDGDGWGLTWRRDP